MNQAKTEYFKLIQKQSKKDLLSRIIRRVKNNAKLGKIKRLIHNHDIQETETILFTGDKFFIVLPDNISKVTYLTGIFESLDTMAFVSLIKKNDVFIDIGSHIGYYSVVASKLIGNQGKAIAFEPTPSTFNLTKKNLDQFKNTEAHNLALYSHNSEITFYDYGIRYMSLNSIGSPRIKDIELEKKTIKVKTKKLDDFLEERELKPNFIKIDAESSELAILKGARRSLENYSPILMVELGDFEEIDATSSIKIIKFLDELGYQPYEFNGRFIKHLMRRDLYPSINIYFSKSDLSN